MSSMAQMPSPVDRHLPDPPTLPLCRRCRGLQPPRSGQKCVQDLPYEVTEYCLSLVSPYQDLRNCMLVCRSWQEIGWNVARRKRIGFTKALKERNLVWHKFGSGSGPAIAARYSHSACQVDDFMYVFGGCTATTTTFNDLWQFNLNDRQWHRLAAVGTYPPPKANATFITYKDKLILFGGWTYTSILNPVHQTRRMFNQLHFYTPETKTWMEVIGAVTPPPMAGHSATIHGHMMVVFGGGHLSERLQNSSNEVWVFDFLTNNWWNPETTDPKPYPRFGQSQIYISDNHILVIGGCGGPNMVFSDTWLLTVSHEIGKPWVWKKITVKNAHFAATHTWYHPACKVGKKVVFFGKSTQSKASLSYTMSHTLPHANRGNHNAPQQNRVPKTADPDACVNGKRGVLTRRSDNLFGLKISESNGERSSYKQSSTTIGAHRFCSRCGEEMIESDPSCIEDGASASKKVCSRPIEGELAGSEVDRLPIISDAPSTSSARGSVAAMRNTALPSVRPNASKNRQRQLEVFLRMEERMRTMLRAPSIAGKRSWMPSKAPCPPTQKSMSMHIMDIGRVLTDNEVEWLPIQNSVDCGGPEETSFYSLVCGIGELIMFGGVQKDDRTGVLHSDEGEIVMSNYVHILSAKPYLL